MLFLKWFWKRNKVVTIIFIVSFILSLLYNYVVNLDKINIEKYTYLFSLINQLLIAYLGSFVFYVIQTAYADYKSWKVYSKILVPKLKRISSLMKKHINILTQRYLNKEYDENRIKESDFNDIYNQLKPEDELTTFDKKGNQRKVSEEQMFHKSIVKEKIYDIFRGLGSNLEEDTQEILNIILESDYFKSVEIIEYNKLGNQNVTSKEAFTSNKEPDKEFIGTGVAKVISTDYKDLYKYHLHIQKLDQYIEKQK